MNGTVGKLSKLEKLLRIPEQGSLSTKHRRFSIVLGLLLTLFNVYVLLFTASVSLSTIAVSLVGIAVALQGIGDATPGQSGSVIRLSSLLLFFVAAILSVMFAYAEFGLTYLLLVSLFMISVLGLIWFLRKTSAGA